MHSAGDVEPALHCGGAEAEQQHRVSGGSTPLRVKLMGNWGPSEQICHEWDRMSQGNLSWNDIQVTWSDEDVDFYVIVNSPWPGESYRPERTIVFQMEPWCPEPHQTWGVKTWGEWSRPDPARFLQVRSHRDYLNNGFWQLKATYEQLRSRPVRKTAVLSSIISPKYFDPGHVKRVDFLRFIEERDDDVVRVDMYAHDNPLAFKSWVGPHPPGHKDAALLPYRYFLGVENNREVNFVTEKLWEPLLTETLCFYWGAPNASDHIDERAFITIDLDDFEAAFNTIKSAILADEWGQRREVLRHEKQRVLEHLQFFPTLERILREDFGFVEPPTDEEVTHHKYFADAIGLPIGSVGFIHSYTRNGDYSTLEELLDSIHTSGLLLRLDRLYIINVGAEIALGDAVPDATGPIRLINRTPDAEPGERLTLELVHNFAAFHPEANILYLHTKGASHSQRTVAVEDWRALMVHVVVERFADCLVGLANNDAVGCELQRLPHPHFSGNFWWARASYLRSLPLVPAADRHDAEWWVLSGNEPRVLSLPTPA